MLKFKGICAVALLAFCATGWAEDAPKAAPADAKGDKEKISYAIGLSVGRNMKGDGLDTEVDVAVIMKGLQDGLSGAKPTFDDAQLRAAMMSLQQRVMEKRQGAAKAVGETNKKAGEAFLAENGKKEGVKTTASGLQYKVIKEGDGPKPKATDTVEVKYRGTLVDGTEFDSSKDQTVTFPVNGVIKGWTEALQLMPVGSQWQLVIPSDLAYGERQAGPQIGPNATLIFDVTLVSIKSSEQPAGAATQPVELQ